MLESSTQPYPAQVLIDIAPAHNILFSFTAVSDARENPGISDWAVQTRDKLTDEEWERHELVTKWITTEVLQNLAGTEQFSKFGKYIDFLAGKDPDELRDEILYWMVQKPGARLNFQTMPKIEDHKSLLASGDAFLTFYQYPEMDDAYVKKVYQVYDLLNDPSGLKLLIMTHIHSFWNKHLADEWQRNLPQLEEKVAGFQNLNFAGMGHFEIIEAVTNRNMRGVLRPEILQTYDTLFFIPSPHCGPYIFKSGNGKLLRIIFDAHNIRERAITIKLKDIDTVQIGDSTEIVDRMKALADETRLEIIKALWSGGEMATQEIIDQFKLSKSAASRHLRQLNVTGIVDIRVDEDGLSKYYVLNPTFALQTEEMLTKMLGS